MYLDSCLPAKDVPHRVAEVRRFDQQVPSHEDPLIVMLLAARLPDERLTASQVVERRLTSLAEPGLWQAVKAGKYFVMPGEGSLSPVFPAWQFISPAPELIPPIIRALQSHPEVERWTFWRSQWDELGDLTCAEIICGKLHLYRNSVSLDDMEILCAANHERQSIVMRQLAFLPSRLSRAGE